MSDQNNVMPNLSQIAQEHVQQNNVVPAQAGTGQQQGQVIQQTPVQTQTPSMPTLPPDDAYILGDENFTPGGLVIPNTPTQEQLPPAANELNKDTLDSISEYMAEAEEDLKYVEKLQEEAEAKKAEEAAKEEEIDPEERAKELEEKYEKAIVIIDKSGMGTVNFTDEEREKLEKVKKIRLEEVETVKVKKFKSKKAKKGSLDHVLKRQPSIHTTPIVATASGYTASIKGASSYELISLMGSSENALIDTETKWSIIHSKIAQTSLGAMSFDEFLKATAAIDYNTFIYGLICATYPDDDKLPLTCVNEQCGKPFEHSYSVRSLLRAEKMSEKLGASIAKIIDGSHTEEGAKQVHDESAVSAIETVELPISGYVFDIYVQSAHDLLYTSIKGLNENNDPKLNQASVLSTVVKTAYIPDPENPGEAWEYTDAIDITKIIFSLSDKDILILSKKSELILDDLAFEFGLMNVTCPHCGHYREEVPFDIESILFYRYQQAMNTEVE